MPPVEKQAILTLAFMLGLLMSCAFAFEAEPSTMWDDWTNFEAKAYTMVEDPGSMVDCGLQYYYHIPNPTYSWFWGYSGWEYGDVIGAWFRVGDQGTGGFSQCDPRDCADLDGFRILDFAGYGTVYPGLFTVVFDVYCADETLEPRLHLWSSGPWETHYAWNYINIDGRLFLDECWESSYEFPRIIITMTQIGTYGVYPCLGFDNVSTPSELGCEMHDISCLPAAYPRSGFGGHEPYVHSGYMGHIGREPFEYWPPRPFPDGKHVNEPGTSTWYGNVEAAWTIYITCSHP